MDKRPYRKGDKFKEFKRPYRDPRKPSVKRKPRKPRDLFEVYGRRDRVALIDSEVVRLLPSNLWAPECRKLAAYLLKAADYLDWMEARDK